MKDTTTFEHFYKYFGKHALLYIFIWDSSSALQRNLTVPTKIYNYNIKMFIDFSLYRTISWRIDKRLFLYTRRHKYPDGSAGCKNPTVSIYVIHTAYYGVTRKKSVHSAIRTRENYEHLNVDTFASLQSIILDLQYCSMKRYMDLYKLHET